MSFYDWENNDLVRRIDIQPKTVYWSDSGELCAIATDDTIYILKYNPDIVSQAIENKDEISEDGIEAAFDVQFKLKIICKI